MKATCRRGVTLIELLVTIAIVSILIALIVPAVQRMRTAGVRTMCANNLKQIGLAVHQYHDQKRCFPAGMSLRKSDLYSSWLAQILPYIEQRPLWELTLAAYKQSPSPFTNPPHVGLATPIPLYVCPASLAANQVQHAPRSNVDVAFTCYLGVSGKDLFSRDGIFFSDSKVSLGEISDGSSNTLLAGERPPSADFQFGWWYAGTGQLFTGSCDMLMGVYEQNVLPVTTGSCAPGSYPFRVGNPGNQCDMFHFWSEHPNGAHFLYADGTVHFLSYAVAPILPALASRAGAEAVDLP